MAETLTFEKVWEMFQETREQMKENDRRSQESWERMKEEMKERMKESDRELREFREFRESWEQSMKEFKEEREKTDLQMKETDLLIKETGKQMKETDRRIGELGNRFGELAEHLVAPSIREKFNELHFTFEQMSQDVVISDSTGRFLAEIDILLENGDTVIAVEVKSKPAQKDIDDHVNRMEILRRRADARRDTRKFRGAIAGAIMKEEVRGYAHKTGFYVIEQTGDTVKINIPENFRPREW
jgi:hypothetical protein